MEHPGSRAPRYRRDRASEPAAQICPTGAGRRDLLPLACPPAVSPANVAAFIAANLSADHFARHLDDPQRVVLLAAVTPESGLRHNSSRGARRRRRGGGGALRPAVELSKIRAEAARRRRVDGADDRC